LKVSEILNAWTHLHYLRLQSTGRVFFIPVRDMKRVVSSWEFGTDTRNMLCSFRLITDSLTCNCFSNFLAVLIICLHFLLRLLPLFPFLPGFSVCDVVNTDLFMFILKPFFILSSYISMLDFWSICCLFLQSASLTFVPLSIHIFVCSFVRPFPVSF
jgi:hypothetical protein